uniref:Endonuclease/exonuclease/phosphatase domain-containing protein n=2 Tax=Nicotiana TaxID=4085 RepID=A0A1S3ZWZ7_TOBAC|nr:PREDICTED: uncharacterized protein LOC104218933 [Nicotiana sylvestris]XP_016468821.1 PREDICTED: uncharacterized protein LOC107791296 [Nicotiana tabacum]
MKVNIVSWNVRGLNRQRKRVLIRSMMNKWTADVFCFQESKLKGDIREIVKELWANRWGNVYAPNDRRDREEVWSELAGARGLFDGPWVVCGDFDTVRFPSEKKNCNRITRGMKDFTDFIEDMELVDMQLAGGNYTWRKSDNHNIAARLDRFLDPIKSYFKFENWWLQTDGFTDRVRHWWNSFSCEGSPDFILAFKLKTLKGKLKEWSRTLQGNLELQKTNVLNQLAQLEEIHDQRPLNEEEIYAKTALAMEFEDIAKHEKAAWRQRSRALWLKQGDKNTKIFHRTTNSHRRYNHIEQLVVQGGLIQNPSDIKKKIVTFYQKLYSEEEVWRPQGNLRNYHILTPEDNQLLQSPFGIPKIWDSVKACGGD